MGTANISLQLLTQLEIPKQMRQVGTVERKMEINRGEPVVLRWGRLACRVRKIISSTEYLCRETVDSRDQISLLVELLTTLLMLNSLCPFRAVDEVVVGQDVELVFSCMDRHAISAKATF